jgi:type II secretory pathway component PulF
LREALQRVGARVREGASLGTALTAEAGLFSGVTVGLVRAGERGVGLGAALDQAATQLEREAETVARIRGALAYPLLLAVVGTVSVLVIVVFVVPRFVALLSDLGQSLPLATRLLIAASVLARRFGLVVVGPVACAFVGARLLVERRARWHAWLSGCRWWARFARRGPARTARTLGALLGSGTPALAALAIAQDASGDAAIAERLAARANGGEGAPLSAALSATQARPKWPYNSSRSAKARGGCRRCWPKPRSSSSARRSGGLPRW